MKDNNTTIGALELGRLLSNWVENFKREGAHLNLQENNPEYAHFINSLDQAVEVSSKLFPNFSSSIEKPKVKQKPLNDCNFVLVNPILVNVGEVFMRAANERGGRGYVEAVVGFGNNFTGYLVVQVCENMINSGYFAVKQ